MANHHNDPRQSRQSTDEEPIQYSGKIAKVRKSCQYFFHIERDFLILQHLLAPLIRALLSAMPPC